MEDIAAFLAKTVLFSVLPPAALPAIARAATRVTLAKGEALFEAGTAGDAVFLVRSGLLQIVGASAFGGRPLGEVARGEHIGEMAVLTGEPRAAGAVAVVESVLYALPGELVRSLFQTHPILWARLSLGLMRNLQNQGRCSARGVRTCALVGAGSAAARSFALTLALAEELGALADEPVAILDCVAGVPAAAPEDAPLPGAFSEVTQTLRRLVTPGAANPNPRVTVVRLGADCAADAPVADLVAELRRRHARVLVHATLPWSALAARGIAQCDALRWVVDDGDAAAGAACTAALAEIGALVRTPATPGVLAFGAGAARVTRNGDAGSSWRAIPAAPGPDVTAALAAPAARRVLRALARELADRRTALVLGAGGAKGFAHIGALRAFERHGIEFDAIAGTSIGAIVGALIAMGWSAATVEALFMGVASNPWKTLFDLRVPTEAFFRSKKKSELIAQYCAGTRIDDMGLPFFAVAGDLTALVPVVFQSGPLALALDATSAIPTVFRPVRHEDQMLVDGWVCDPLPAGVVRAAGFERVIAIDLSPRGRPTVRRPAPSGAPPGLGGRLRILAIAMRAMELASQEHVARSLPLIDVLVRPDLDGFSSADLDGAAEMCDRGERAAEEAIPAIREGQSAAVAG